MSNPDINAFFDEKTCTVSYVVSDPVSRAATIIDPVLDYECESGRTSTKSVDAIVEFVQKNDLQVRWILETHVHADHMSGASPVRDRLGGSVAIGNNVCAVQQTFRTVFNLQEITADGSQFDHLFTDGDTFRLGSIDCRVMATPGHTPSCVTYVIGDAAFVGDTLFMPDFGTARTDFPGGSAEQLYDSIQAILSLPDDTRLFMCHDYKAPGRDEFVWETTVREQRERNIHINESVSKDEFVEMRKRRDSELAVPKLILPSIQVNIRAGRLPDCEDNGVRYLKVPLNTI